MKKGKVLLKEYLIHSILIFIGLILIPNIGNGQSCHSGGGDHSSHGNAHSKMNMASHGGIVKKAGKYYIEMVKDPMSTTEKVLFFVLNKKGETIPSASITGMLNIMNKKGDVIKGNLTKNNNNGFVMEVTDINPVNVIASFVVKKKTITSTFPFENNAQDSSLYSCSMHPEITADNPGKCPKCGMKLTLSSKI